MKVRYSKLEYSKNTIIARFEGKFFGAKGHDKKAYSIGYRLAFNLPNDAMLVIRETKNGAFNIGDLGEAFVKLVINNTLIAGVSSQGKKDIQRRTYHEVKTFSSANRNPNGFKKAMGFLAICELGVYEIKRESIAQRWAQFKDNKGLKEISLAILKDIIKNDNPKRLHDLSATLLGA